MIWREIRDLYGSACGVGGSPDQRALEKFYTLASEGQRMIFALDDVPELYRRTTVNVIPSQDWVPTPDGVLSIQWMENRTGGHKMRREPDGSSGRAKFFAAGTDAPPTGTIESVHFWWREGEKIWLRDTPNSTATGVLELEYKFQPPTITRDNLDESPDLPEQYHMPLVNVLVGMYYQLHPPLDPSGQVPMVTYGDQKIAGAIQQITGVYRNPRAEENLDHRKTIVQPGYQMGGLR